MKEINLTRGYVALVDDEDYDNLMQHCWTESNGYAVAFINSENVYMHNFILSATSYTLDHKDHNGLNNQRNNLREATHRQNCYNRIVPQSVNGTGYRGVIKDRDKYRARIAIEDGRRVNLGCFLVPEDAARAYDNAAREHHGEFAVLNFPNETVQLPYANQPS